ncbi:MAG: hypothetical protein AABY10_03905 [Nanoarchaeota archaeon]
MVDAEHCKFVQRMYDEITGELADVEAHAKGTPIHSIVEVHNHDVIGYAPTIVNDEILHGLLHATPRGRLNFGQYIEAREIVGAKEFLGQIESLRPMLKECSERTGRGYETKILDKVVERTREYFGESLN